MAVNKNKISKPKRRSFTMTQKLVLGAGTVLALVIIYGLNHTESLRVASAGQIEQARRDIINQGYRTQATDCAHDNLTYEERLRNFGTYFKVNKYANRAVLRGCNDTDMLIAKTNDGHWHTTSVNISLINRVSPMWQNACLIQDITVADDVVRPENNSIDEYNLDTCEYIHKYNEIKPVQ